MMIFDFVLAILFHGRYACEQGSNALFDWCIYPEVAFTDEKTVSDVEDAFQLYWWKGWISARSI